MICVPTETMSAQAKFACPPPLQHSALFVMDWPHPASMNCPTFQKLITQVGLDQSARIIPIKRIGAHRNKYVRVHFSGVGSLFVRMIYIA